MLFTLRWDLTQRQPINSTNSPLLFNVEDNGVWKGSPFFFFLQYLPSASILEAPRLGFLFSLQLARRFLWLSTYNYFSIKALICYVVSTAPWRFGKNEDETVNLFSAVSLDENRVRLGPGEAAAEPRWDFKGSYARRKPKKKASFGLYVGGRNFFFKFVMLTVMILKVLISSLTHFSSCLSLAQCSVVSFYTHK